MNITMIGTGYVGLVTGTCLAEVGNTVFCIDKDVHKVEQLSDGLIPIFEPGLEELVKSNVRENRLFFTTELRDAVPSSELFFIAVGTPAGEDGSADLTHVLEVAEEIGRTINKYSIIINKSTVPVGTVDKVKEVIAREINERGIDIEFDVVSNPEFLKQGAAISDFMKPDRIIIGCDSKRVEDKMRQLYAPFIRAQDRLMFMKPRAAELTKYAANSILATKISFMNEIAEICERVGVDVESVRKGIGADARIGYSFIYPGCGFGGSCFPKDLKALIHIAEEQMLDPQILKSVYKRNQTQKKLIATKIFNRFGSDLTGYTLGLWGLAFKPETDDMREAPSIDILEELINAGAQIKAYDPVAISTAKKVLPSHWMDSGQLQYVNHQYEALDGADAMILVTEWKSFRTPDLKKIRKLLKNPIIFDGRNQYDPALLKEEGFEYYGIGR